MHTRVQMPATYKDKKSTDMFSWLRFIHAQDSEAMLLPTDPAKIDEIEPLTIRNELEVFETHQQGVITPSHPFWL